MSKGANKSGGRPQSSHSGSGGNWPSTPGQKSGGRPQSSHPGPGGNWPSTTGQKSGGGRGNAKGK